MTRPSEPPSGAPRSNALPARLTRRALWASVEVGCRGGLERWLLEPRPGPRILVWHGIDRAGRTDLNGRFVAVSDLEGLLDWLADNARVVPLAALLDGELDSHRPTVALTFDDGYAGVLHHALPALTSRLMPATFFVTAIRASGGDLLWPDAADLAARWATGPVNVNGETFRRTRRGLVSAARGDRLADRARGMTPEQLAQLVAGLRAGPLVTLDLEALWEYWRPLTADELRELAGSPLATIGAHGASHADLERMPAETVRAELEAGRRWLESLTGRTVDLLAWPFGSADAARIQVARELGFRHQLLGDPWPEGTGEPDVHGRLVVNPFVTWRVNAWALLRGRW